MARFMKQQAGFCPKANSTTSGSLPEFRKMGTLLTKISPHIPKIIRYSPSIYDTNSTWLTTSPYQIQVAPTLPRNLR